MNERIQKLLDAARGKVYMDTLGAAVDNKLWDEMVHEKFAELIVRECMNLCSEVKKDLEVVPDKLEREATEMGVTFCYEAIKGEFGVEE
jgi:hypothetical protein